jgi:hypothetical protein
MRRIGKPVCVMDLLCGDVIETPMGALRTYVLQGPHPIHPGLQLAVFREHVTGLYRFDCLSLTQSIGTLQKFPTTDQKTWAIGLEP